MFEYSQTTFLWKRLIALSPASWLNPVKEVTHRSITKCSHRSHLKENMVYRWWNSVCQKLVSQTGKVHRQSPFRTTVGTYSDFLWHTKVADLIPRGWKEGIHTHWQWLSNLWNGFSSEVIIKFLFWTWCWVFWKFKPAIRRLTHWQVSFQQARTKARNP